MVQESGFRKWVRVELILVGVVHFGKFAGAFAVFTWLKSFGGAIVVVFLVNMLAGSVNFAGVFDIFTLDDRWCTTHTVIGIACTDISNIILLASHN